MFLALLLGIVAHPVGTLTYECKAQPVKQVLKEIGDKVGLSLSSDRALAERSLLVRFTETPPETALNKIAEVLGGEWRDVDGGKTLAPSRVLADSAAQAERAGLTKALEKQIKAAAGLQPLTKEEAEKTVKEVLNRTVQNDQWDSQLYESDQARTAGRRALTRFMQIMGAKELATSPSQKRLVWCTSPTAMQRPMPKAVWEVFDRYTRENDIYNDALETLAPNGNEGKPYTPLLNRTMKYESAPDALGLVRTYEALGGGYTYVLFAWGKEAQELCRWNIRNDLMDDFQKPKETVTGLTGKFEPGPQTAATMAAISRTFRRTGGEAAPEDLAWLRGQLKDLDHSQILTEAVSEMTLTGLHQKGLDAVIVLPDIAIVLMMADVNKEPDLQTLWTRTYGSGIVRMTVGEKFVSAKPDPKTPFNFSLPRAAVSALCRSVEKEGVTIDNLADFCKGADLPGDGMLGLMVASIGYPDVLPSIQDPTRSFQILKFYGNLDLTTRTKVKNGGISTPFSSLPVGAQAILKSMVYDDADLSAQPGDPSTGTGIRSVETTTTEPTLRVPNGIPMNAKVSVKFLNEKRLFKQTSYGDGPGYLQVSDPRNLAYDIAWQEREPRGGKSTFANGVLKQLDVNLQLLPDLFESRSYQLLPHFNPDDLVTWDKLPDDQRKVIEEGLVQARKSYQNYNPGNPNGRIKP
ncbi:MAG: hypothetical protein JSS66_18240 [Armatimonadetes bacterium]|nr:hypothetical protein [Armatimonadota bacterium]